MRTPFQSPLLPLEPSDALLELLPEVVVAHVVTSVIARRSVAPAAFRVAPTVPGAIASAAAISL